MDLNVFVEQDITKLRVFVGHVPLTHSTMEEIVSVIMDTLATLINVKSVMKAVESVLERMLINVSHAQM